MLLANGDISAGQWCCPVVLPNVAVQFAVLWRYIYNIYIYIYIPSDLRALLFVHVELLCSGACDFRVRFKGAAKTCLV